MRQRVQRRDVIQVLAWTILGHVNGVGPLIVEEADPRPSRARGRARSGRRRAPGPARPAHPARSRARADQGSRPSSCAPLNARMEHQGALERPVLVFPDAPIVGHRHALGPLPVFDRRAVFAVAHPRIALARLMLGHPARVGTPLHLEPEPVHAAVALAGRGVERRRADVPRISERRPGGEDINAVQGRTLSAATVTLATCRRRRQAIRYAPARHEVRLLDPPTQAAALAIRFAPARRRVRHP